MAHLVELYKGLMKPSKMNPIELYQGPQLFFKTFVDKTDEQDFIDDNDSRINLIKSNTNVGFCVNKHKRRVVRYRPIRLRLNRMEGEKLIVANETVKPI